MNREVLEEIILNVNARTGIRNDILEKDYYVCLVLKDLATKQKDLQAYFKGGTALYKILNHMNRFSEDIDLTVKINEFDSNNSNRQRLKKAALGYEISGLELIKSETVDRKGSITSFYRYDSLFSFNELFKSGKVQIEATSFTISEPLGTYFIEPLIYKYASDHEKKILKNVYQISEFSIEIIMLERIFADKIFAAEFYYEREMYQDVCKHIYDIAVLMKHDNIKALLNTPSELIKLIELKREEEILRKGGIPSNLMIKDFNYLKLEFNDSFIACYQEMQKVYVLDDESKIDFEAIKEVLNQLLKLFKKINV